MTRIEWPSLARALLWTLSVAFVLASVLFGLYVFLPHEHPPPQEDFVESILDEFALEQARWPIEGAATALYAIGFLTLGALGPVLARLADVDDARRGIVTAAFLATGGLGAASQLVGLGVKPIATSTQYCECGLLAEEIMSRLMILNVVGGVLAWLVSGALFALAIGLIVAAALGRESGMPAGWVWLSLVTAALALANIVAGLLRAFPFDVLLTLLVAGVLAPAWAIWLASRAFAIWPRDQAVAEEGVALEG